MNSVGTKQKILNVAKELFAKGGFSATSMREIAQQADVNLAAINYHFKTKEFLYWQVFEENCRTIQLGVERCGKKTETTAELAVAVYQFFLSKDDAIMNIFKMFLSDRVIFPSEDPDDLQRSEMIGPPGSEVFFEKIEQDVGIDVSTAGKDWAVRMIFSLLVHQGILMNTEVMKKKCRKDSVQKKKATRQYLVHSVNAHLQYLRNNPELEFEGAD